MVERGSTLSHSAVLARELGIPAVVGIRGSRTQSPTAKGQTRRPHGDRAAIIPVPGGRQRTNPSLHDRVRPLVCGRLGVVWTAPDGELLDDGLYSVCTAELTVELAGSVEFSTTKPRQPRSSGSGSCASTGTDGAASPRRPRHSRRPSTAGGIGCACICLGAFNAGGIRDRLPFASREPVYRDPKVLTPSSRADSLFHALQCVIYLAVATDADVVPLDGHWHK